MSDLFSYFVKFRGPSKRALIYFDFRFPNLQNKGPPSVTVVTVIYTNFIILTAFFRAITKNDQNDYVFV